MRIKIGKYNYTIEQKPIKVGEWAIASNTSNGEIRDFKGCKPIISKYDYAASPYFLKIISTDNPEINL